MNIIKNILNLIPLNVFAGPFRGTRCKLTSTGDGVVAKIAGTYEMEIYPAFKAAVERGPSVVVDIGSAEGFYVAALARSLPDAHVIAYEAKEEWWPRIRRIMSLNGVSERCEIRGYCDHKEFATVLESNRGKSVFVLMDIEGGEFELLNQKVVPLLEQTELLVELHDGDAREKGEALVKLLEASHKVDVIWARSNRTLKDVQSPVWRLACTLLPSVRSRLQEGRAYQMRWLHAVPRHRGGDAEVTRNE